MKNINNKTENIVKTDNIDDYEIIYVAYFTRKGKRYYARNYGKKAWPIKVKVENN